MLRNCAELAALYAERWEFESALDELKAHQRGPRVVLRSKTPEGARQEAWGYLCAHYAIRALMASATGDRGVDPDKVSFTRALHAARRTVHNPGENEQRFRANPNTLPVHSEQASG